MAIMLLMVVLLSMRVICNTLAIHAEAITEEAASKPVLDPIPLPLNDATRRGFSAREDITSYLLNEIQESGYKKVAEFGPGGVSRRFPHANILIDHFASKLENVPADITTYQVDIDVDQVPVEDYAFDFVYCRHLMEDINNPIGAFREMTRLSKRGYIETPSPLIESTVIERVSNGIPGYTHHRFLFWTDTATNTLYAIQKFPTINLIQRSSAQIKKWHQFLHDYPPMFNNYYQWDVDMDLLPKLVMLKHEVAYDIDTPITYANLIDQGIQLSVDHSISFFEGYINPFVQAGQRVV